MKKLRRQEDYSQWGGRVWGDLETFQQQMLRDFGDDVHDKADVHRLYVLCGANGWATEWLVGLKLGLTPKEVLSDGGFTTKQTGESATLGKSGEI